MDSGEVVVGGKAPRLLKWSGHITTKMLATQLILNGCQKKALQHIITSLNDPSPGKVVICPPIPEKWRVVCCLPFLLGSGSCTNSTDGSNDGDSLDLRSSVLILATSTDTLSHLQDKLANLVMDGSQLYFKTTGVTSDIYISGDSIYHIFLVKHRKDVSRLRGRAGRCGVILSHLSLSALFPAGMFSEVLVYSNHSLSMEEVRQLRHKFHQDLSVILFTGGPYRHLKHSRGLEPNFPPLPLSPLGVSIVRDRKVCAGITLLTRKPELVSDWPGSEPAGFAPTDPIAKGPETKVTLGAAPKSPRPSSRWLQRSKSGQSKLVTAGLGLEEQDPDGSCHDDEGEGLNGDKKEALLELQEMEEEEGEEQCGLCRGNKGSEGANDCAGVDANRPTAVGRQSKKEDHTSPKSKMLLNREVS